MTVLMILLVAFVLVSGCTFPVKTDRTWTKENTILEITSIALDAVDWQQTREIAYRPDKYAEANPILGSHPKDVEVNRYFGIMRLVKSAAVYATPNPYRKWLQRIFIGVTATVTGHNYSLGLTGKW
jgi:hypothetical protein